MECMLLHKYLVNLNYFSYNIYRWVFVVIRQIKDCHYTQVLEGDVFKPYGIAFQK